MEIQFLGKNKLGLVDRTMKKWDFDRELGHQWDRCNAIILGWITSSGIVYAKNARAVWKDLRERFDKVNTLRVY